MKKCVLLGVVFASALAMAGTRIAVHPQAFDAGGWKLDVQFMDEMGSPMLLAHGAGVPVADAQATVSVPEAGEWRVRVRARNWADGNPGAFKVRIGGTTLAKTFGVSQREWAWEDGGTVTLAKGETTVALRDLTGFEGRCAGVLLEKGDGLLPFEGALSVADEKPVETVEASFCIVGGGIPGCAAALAAARSGVRTVLVNDRPYLGGNASREIRIWCAGEGISQPIIRSLRGYFYNGDGGAWTGDDRRIALLTREENIDLRLSTRAFGVTKTADGRIASVKAIDWKRNRVIEIKANLFLDATGDGWIGAYAGADWRMGREAKGETGESMAPDKADGDTLGASLVWSSRRGTADVPFSAPWAEPHAQGVVAVEGDWNWEYGIHRDMVADAEGIRDRLFLAIYGSFSLAKRDPANARNVLDNVPFLLGKRESRRLMGDHLFCEKDVVERIPHPDAIAKCSWPIDLHFDDAKPGIDFQTRCTSGMHGRSYVPFRSIYSRNVANLMMAGRCFSCTHVGLGSPRVINTLAQMGVAAGYAAMICGREGILPRELGKRGLVREIQRLMGGDWPGNPDPAHAKWTFIDDEDESVRFGKGWVCNHMCNGEQFGEKAHVVPPKARKIAEPAVYPLPVAKKGRYRLYAKSPFQPWPMDKATGSAAFEVQSEGKTTEILFNQYLDQGTWRTVGDFDLAPGASLTIMPAKSTAKGDLFADGFALEPLALATAVKITFVGDALCHGPMLEAYRVGPDRYDFSSVFADVKPLFAASDFVVANLETPIAPDNCGLTRERWSFCSPKEFAVALKEAGVDFVFTANNHCLDRGPEGVKRTIAALDEIGLPHTGTFATPAAADEPTVLDIGGFRIGLMAATYGSNAFSNHQYLDEGNRFMVNLFQDQELSESDARVWFGNRTSAEGRAYAAREAKRWPDNLTLQAYERIERHDRQREKIREDVAKMKAKRPDFILMGMHAGGQYNAAETKYTKELASFLSACGIDWLVGSHEHVVHGSDFSGFRDGRLVTYSLGNFDGLSGTWFAPHDKMAEYSVAWHVYLTREAGGKARVEKTTFTVLKTVKDEKPNTIRVVPAADLYARETDPVRKAAIKADIVEIARRFCGRSFTREEVALEYEAASRPQDGALTVDDRLPAGNVIVEKIDGDTISVRQDLRGMRKGEGWFYWAFRVKGAAGRTLTFRFTDPYGGGPVGLRGPVVSLDRGKSYAYPLDGKATKNAFTYAFPKDADEVWFYECHPYLQADWDAFLARHVAERGRSFETDVLCRSKHGRAVEKGVFGCLKDPKHTVLVSSRHHASESLATYVLEGFLEAVLAKDDLGAWYRANVAVMAVPFMDKDGCEEGEQGKNRDPHDHNRDYTEFVHPETKATTEWIKARTDNKLDVWLDFHCPWIRGAYNEFVYSPLKRDANGRNGAAEVRFDALVEKLQTGSLAYKASDDLPYGKAWNNGGNYSAGWSCINWAINVLPEIKLAHTFEIPFASANGKIVTPDSCRELGRDIARAMREFLEAPPPRF